MKLSHLESLESESIHILREVMAEARHPVMLYSIGKDSSVLLHLARKAFYPSPLPFPLLHIDTTWKFRDMISFRDKIVSKYNLQLIKHTNQEGLNENINPLTHPSTVYTDVMKTAALKQALDQHGFDIAIGGARRDEEKSRAKERIFSIRQANHRWDPKHQRPELWNIYNTRIHKGESIRVFPLSNWTELDIWSYIHQENIDIVPLYFAAKRPVVTRNEQLIMLDDERLVLESHEQCEHRFIRFRTLGCYPLTAAVESQATDVASIVNELLTSRFSERFGRMIDHDAHGSMEKKKQEGYF